MCLLSKKCDKLSESVAFGQQLSYFVDQNGTKEWPHKNEFWVFLKSEMNITNRSKKVDEKSGAFSLVSMFPSWVMVLKLSKKA